MNSVMFLLFIHIPDRSRESEGGRGRRGPSVIIDCRAGNIMNWIWELSFPHTFHNPPPSPPSLPPPFTVTTVSPGVSVFPKGHICCTRCCCVTKTCERIDPRPSSRCFFFKQSHARGIHLSWFGFVPEVTRKHGLLLLLKIDAANSVIKMSKSCNAVWGRAPFVPGGALVPGR